MCVPVELRSCLTKVPMREKTPAGNFADKKCVKKLIIPPYVWYTKKKFVCESYKWIENREQRRIPYDGKGRQKEEEKRGY